MHAVVMRPQSIPDGYPHELERTARLGNGASVFIRPIVPEDAPRLAEEILVADSETLYLRFFTTNVQPDAAMLEALTVLDYRERLGVAMLSATGDTVGVARYGAIDASSVEVAVSVKKRWRRLNAGNVLLATVEEAASRRGYTKAIALHLTENQGAQRLLEQRNYRRTAVGDGIAEMVLDLSVSPSG